MLLQQKEHTIKDHVNIRKVAPPLAETEPNIVPSRKDKNELDGSHLQE